jgi:hypothetical protein
LQDPAISIFLSSVLIVDPPKLIPKFSETEPKAKIYHSLSKHLYSYFHYVASFPKFDYFGLVKFIATVGTVGIVGGIVVRNSILILVSKAGPKI